VPDKPTGLEVTFNGCENGKPKIDFKWNSAARTDHYTIDFADNSATCPNTWKDVGVTTSFSWKDSNPANEMPSDSSCSGYQDKTPNSGKHYWWKVNAINSAGVASSEIKDFTTQACAPPPPAKTILNVPLYSQGSYGNEYYVSEAGQKKSNYAYNCGGSTSFISNTGCFPTSAAMVLDYYGKNYGVVNAANSCTDNGCHPIDGNCGGSSLPYYSLGSDPYCSAVFESAGLGSYFVWNKANGGAPFRADDLFQITDAVATGFPVIVLVSPYYSFNHAMVVKGYEINNQGNVTLYVNDPNGALWQTITNPSLILLGQVIYP
jgi:hypothetical protein